MGSVKDKSKLIDNLIYSHYYNSVETIYKF